MKQVYDCEQFISLSPRMEFQYTSFYDHLHLLDAEQALDATNRTYYKNFKDFFEACVDGKVRNADAYLGIFNTPKVEIRCGLDRYTITARNFPDCICVWNHAKNVSHYSMKKLMENLPADEFAEYLQERNISLQTN